MSNDLYKKTSWFMTASHCSYSGLAITHPESFVCGAPESDLHVDIALLGQNMILVKAYGYFTSSAESEFQACVDAFISKHIGTENRFVYLEDYGCIIGGDAESRKKYISYFKNKSFLIAAILYHLPPIFKISFNLVKKLHIYAATAHAVNTYEQAIDLAISLTGKNAGRQHSAHGESALTKEFKNRPSSTPFAFNLLGRFYRVFATFTGVNLFFTEKAKQQLKTQISEELLAYIASIDWKTPGIQPPESILYKDILTGRVFDAISFVKSEIDSLMAERDAAEAVLRESEARYRLLVKHAKAGFLEYNYTTRQIISVNDEFVHMTGYPEQELLGKNPIELLTKESQKIFQHRLSQIFSGQSIPPDIVYQMITKENTLRWVLLNSNVTYRNHRPEKASVVITDISRLKETETRLLEYQKKLKRLSVRTSMIEEDQRRSMASHLHETIGQELFVMQLQLNAFEKSIDNPALLSSLKQIQEQLLKIIKETKNLTFDLSPRVLYDFGFREALQTLANNIELQHNIRVWTYFEGDMDAFGDELKIILYRNIKELIHNAVKHAAARNITIRLTRSSEGLNVELCDDGVGFDAAGYLKKTASEDGFGLFDIREKLNHLDGNLIIASIPGQGTTICMQVPMQLRN